MTLAAALRSTFSTATGPADPPHDREATRRCAVSKRSLGVLGLALPAMVLRNTAVARWARTQGVAVDVRDSHELAVAMDAGIHPMRMTVHSSGLSPNELVFCAANLGAGRVVVDANDQLDLLAATARRRQRVLVGLRRLGSGLASSVFDCPRLDLVGMHCEIGPAEHQYVSYPAAIGDVLADMSQIRRDHAVVLTRIALGGCGLTFGAGRGDLSEIANEIDETLDDACATLRFPRPVVMVTAQPASVRVD